MWVNINVSTISTKKDLYNQKVQIKSMTKSWKKCTRQKTAL